MVVGAVMAVAARGEWVPVLTYLCLGSGRSPFSLCYIVTPYVEVGPQKL